MVTSQAQAKRLWAATRFRTGTKTEQYIEDVTVVLDHHRLRYHRYTDDMQGLIDCKLDCISQISDAPGDCINDVCRWCACKRIRLNPGKTEILCFCTAP